VNKLHLPLPYRGWRTPEILLSLLLFSATVSMLVISAINLKVILLSSGLPAFIEDETKATMISLLAPIAAISIKLLPMALEFRESKRRYQKALFVITTFVIIAWIYLTSQTFDGFGDIAIDDILESAETGDGGAYVMTQLLVEILMGASLFSAWQSLHDAYQPRKINPYLIRLNKEIARLEQQAATASESVNKAKHHVETHKTQRQVFVNQQLEALALMKAKNQFMNNFFGEDK
jgi:hypothetical protein